MAHDDQHGRTKRRTFLKVASAVSVAGLAGCISGGDTEGGGNSGNNSGGNSGNNSGGNSGNNSGSSGKNVLTFGTPNEGSNQTEALTATQRAVDRTSDKITLRLEQTSGNVEQIRLYNGGSFDGYNATQSTILAASEDRGAFEQNPVEDVGSQVYSDLVYHFYFLAVNDSGIKTFDDVVNGDSGVYLLQPGYGFREIIIDILKSVGAYDSIKDRLVNVDVGQAANAIDEGRIKTFFAYSTNYNTLSGWLNEIDTRAKVHVVKNSKSLIQGYKDSTAGSYKEIKPYGWEQDVGEKVGALQSPSYMMINPDVPNAAVSELCRVVQEENQVVREGMKSYLDFSDGDRMTGPLTNQLPIHEGAKQYYDKKGISYPGQ